ncbi:hypothetical protein [Streptomyces sp. HUAS TT7]|uniref:hypothetical protein n=1 Tax=Streptomyces sp. HUAS TT7 TaxID=3447507 RepID=UPI003F65A113
MATRAAKCRLAVIGTAPGSVAGLVLLAQWSLAGPVAYVEAEYFAGIRLRTVMIVSARSKKASTTVVRRS